MYSRLILLIFISYYSCQPTKENKEVIEFQFDLTNFSDQEYEDDPDLGYRSEEYQNELFNSGVISFNNSNFDLEFFGKDTLLLSDININGFIPKVPECLKDNAYLSLLSIVNQEWNRNQVQFSKDYFRTTSSKITRVDIARNCLNSYLWEIIVFSNESGKDIPYAHSWFNFPDSLYKKLFNEVNDISFEDFENHLLEWNDLPSEKIVLDNAINKLSSFKASIEDKSFEMYPLKGARLKKHKEIVYPETVTRMKDLQSDSTLFATFSFPGCYNRSDPRETELGRFYNLIGAEYSQTIGNCQKDTLTEIKLAFTNKMESDTTQLVIGGLRMEDFPTLPVSKSNSGWKNSMGFGNHTFYENIDQNINHNAQNLYYAYLCDYEEKWLDSHKIGIDGPIFHWDENDPDILHLWLLSFERHALVGHYLINLSEENTDTNI